MRALHRAGRGPWVLAGLALLAVALLVGVAVGGSPLADDRPDGEEVLERAGDRYDSAETVVGNATVTAGNGTNATTATVEFAFGTDNRSRVVVTSKVIRPLSTTIGNSGEMARSSRKPYSACWPTS